jgi:uncharacterized protein YdcH (DUF465 family)
MAGRNDFEAIRKIQERLNTAGDDAIASLSSKALGHVKNILKLKKGSDHTAAFHTILQKHEKLDGAVKRMNESLQFLKESQRTMKRDWQALAAADAKHQREALFALLFACEALDDEYIVERTGSESKKLNKIMTGLRKIKNSDPKSCESFSKLLCEFEHSLQKIDSIIGSRAASLDEFDVYSKFSSDLGDLGVRIKTLNENLRFFQDEHTKDDWEQFLRKDLERLKESTETAHTSCEKFISVL